MSAQGRPVTDTRNDVAVEYVSTHTLPYMMILLQPVGRLRRMAMAAQTAIMAKAKNAAAEALNAAGLDDGVGSVERRLSHSPSKVPEFRG